ncbi:MAG: replication-associated recombination protein A, partial [Pseudomonadota bacterium]
MMDLFDAAKSDDAGGPRPLADRMRPKSINEVVGQDHIVGPGGPLGAMLAAGELSSLILWGPPGVGKTTIAKLLADATDLAFEEISAIFSGVADLKRVFEAARMRHAMGRGTLLFVDEIHRFNKAQQDGFLPHMERGAIILVGATTENPSFELNAALLSRAQVVQLKRLESADLSAILARTEAVTSSLALTPDGRDALIAMADGDGRMLLNLVEQALLLGPGPHDAQTLSERLNRRSPNYDKSGDGHYNLISALHKSVRGSDPDAALYWLARMLDGGEDPRFLARRITRMAVEDIGLADPVAMQQCISAWQTYERLGSPEGEKYEAERKKLRADIESCEARVRDLEKAVSVEHQLDAAEAELNAKQFFAASAKLVGLRSRRQRELCAAVEVGLIERASAAVECTAATWSFRKTLDEDLAGIIEALGRIGAKDRFLDVIADELRPFVNASCDASDAAASRLRRLEVEGWEAASRAAVAFVAF